MSKEGNRRAKEEAELEQAYQSMVRPPRKRRPADQRKKVPLIACCAAAAVILIGLIVFLCSMPQTPSAPQTLGNITAAGISLSGMTEQEAKSALHLATDNSYSRKDMVIQVLDTTVGLSPADTGAFLDVDAVVEAALGYGASTDPIALDLIPYLNLDTDAVRQVVDSLGTIYGGTLAQTTYTVEGEQPSLAPVQAGEQVTCQTLVITIGTPEYGLDLTKLYNDILAAYNCNTFLVEANCEYVQPAPLDLQAIYDAYYIPPVDAVMDPKTFEVTPETYGYGFDLDAAEAMMAAAEYGQVLEIPMERIAPEVTGESLSSLLYRDELASYSSQHTSNANRNTNLRLACEAINGMILYPGDVFSYNQALGERTEAKGYKPAPSYVGTATVDTVGGGICQVSSSLYYCALVADLEIVERAYHTYCPSYMPLGTDATVNWGTLDFRFRNNTNYPIRIEAEVSNGYVNVRLIGTDEKDYYVKIESEVTATYDYSSVYQVMRPDNAQGYTNGQVLVSPYTGRDVQTYRCKYDKATGALLAKTPEDDSHYRKRDQVICKIEETPTEPPAEATEPPTEATEPPTEATEPPVEPTEPPVEPTTPEQPPEESGANDSP